MIKRRSFRSFAFLVLLIVLLIGSLGSSSSSVQAYSLGMGNYQITKPNKLNLLILIQASHTSSGNIGSESDTKTKLEVMRESVLSVLEENILPTNTNIGIMAFGHLAERDLYKATCSVENIEMVLPFQLASENIDSTELMKITGKGETPITLALEEAGKNFPASSPDTLNVILLVADSTDTCQSSPADEAKILSENQQIVIYTISFRSGAKELKSIAQNGSGKNFTVPGLNTDSQKALEDLKNALKSAFIDILTRVSISPLPPTVPTTNTFTPTGTATPSSTAIVPTTLTPSITPTQIIPKPASITPDSTAIPPSSSNQTLVITVAAIFFLGVLGLWFWMSRTTTKIVDQASEVGNLVKTDDSLEEFWRDTKDSYASTGMNKYIPLELLKQKLSSKYTQEQFDELLIQARRKYPNKIWIDKDAKGQTLVKINL